MTSKPNRSTKAADQPRQLVAEGADEIAAALQMEGETETVVVGFGQGAGDTRHVLPHDDNLAAALTDICRQKHADIVVNSNGNFRQFALDFRNGTPTLPIKSLSTDSLLNETVIAGCNVGLVRSKSNTVRIEKAVVGYLEIDSEQRTLVKLSHCQVGTLVIARDFLGRLSISNSSICELRFPRDAQISAIDLVTCSFSTQDRSIRGPHMAPSPIVNRQALHNLRVWTEAIGDKKTAHFARALEMRAEKNAETGVFKLLLVLHQWFSSYGAKPLRPLVWMLAAYVLVALVFLLWDGGAIGVPTWWLKGWQVILNDDSETARLNRSLVAAFQGIVNPFSLFSARKLVEANHWWMSGILFAQSLFSLAMIFLSLSAIRRRFHFG